MFRKKLLSIVLISFFICAASGYSQAKPINENEAGNAVYEAEKTASEFLCHKMKTLVSHNIDEIDTYFSGTHADSQKYLMFIKKNLLQDYTIAYASGDYVILNTIPRVKIIHAAVDGTSAEIRATLSTEILWNSANSQSGPITGQKTERHLIRLIKEGQQWKIFQDIFQTKRGSSEIVTRDNLDLLRDEIERLKEDAKRALAKASRSKPTRLTPLRFQQQPYTLASKAHSKINKVYQHSYVPMENSVMNKTFFHELNLINKPFYHELSILNKLALCIPTLCESSQYNRKFVYNWAYMHWNNYSAAYINFGDEKWKGGDCTNFVSQCLRAGGAENDKTGSYQWYYDGKNTGNTADDSYSWTWTTARGLNSILLGNFKTGEFGPKATEKVISGDNEYSASTGEFVLPGDIIQYHWKTKSTITHAAVIVDMLYNSAKKRYEPVIAEHTEDSWYTPWTNNALKTYFVHITGVN